ncbi:GA module-containing protein, partial [Staphylococcus auricularis]
GQLTHLTDEQLASYQDQINKANDKATIDDIVEQAKTQDATNLLNRQKGEGTDTVQGLSHLKEEEAAKFEQQITNATDQA